MAQVNMLNYTGLPNCDKAVSGCSWHDNVCLCFGVNDTASDICLGWKMSMRILDLVRLLHDAFLHCFLDLTL